MANISCDVAIIGAGTAGLAAERAARRQGARTLLIDPAFDGTTCTNDGCMPSKLLIAAGNAAHAATHAALFGIDCVVRVDGAEVFARLQHEREGFIAGVRRSLESLPADVMHKGRARFLGPTTIGVDDGTIVDAGAVVIASGAMPSVADFLHGLERRVLTNETLFDLKALPPSLAVIGAGPLGLELAQALARLGVDIAVFDEGDRPAGVTDPAIAQVLLDILDDEFPIHLGVQLTAKPDPSGVSLSWTGQSRGEGVFSHVLAATGRPPVLNGLHLEASGLALDEHGAPNFDPATMRCGDAPIFMAGDVNHARPVLHEAQADGTIAGRNAACFPDSVPGRRMVPFSIMFTDPPLASIGDLDGKDSVIASASYADQGRAKVEGVNRGLARLHADPVSGKLIGAILATPAAEHIAHFLVMAIDRGLTASEILALPFYHPTFEEGLKPALREICSRTGGPVAMERDDGFLAGA
ncbi:dihydrolipoyl dehydrogenase [Novosphingobium kaempferiae]|uniref:dihydrolipoyl dehydrogenase n=1 Tax=Novosphingobium kaempferiae TaxID=2896849 RepID=UPI001E408F06|nr:dihydrolipoyl dehydrogenase [Novosphingobium kaempferiae]